MNICQNAVKASTRPISGHLYHVMSLNRDSVYIYCGGKNLFINLESGSFADYEESSDVLVDVTDQYCLKEV